MTTSSASSRRPRPARSGSDEHGDARFRRMALIGTMLTDEHDAFFIRVYAPGDYRFHGADLGILVTKGRMQNDEGLTDLSHKYIQGIRDLYVSEPMERIPRT